MEALVTGSHGFIGRHFAQHLRTEGWRVAELDVNAPDDYGPCVSQDAAQFFLDDTYQYDLVIHAAANVGGRRHIENSPLFIHRNYATDSLLIEWAQRTRPGTVVCFSSSAAYPMWLQERGSQHRLRESDITPGTLVTPDAAYGRVKLALEDQAAQLHADGVRTLVFRPFSGYGSDQSLDYPFPSFIARALDQGTDTFEIWGDGTQVRDWIHVDDIVGAVMAAVDNEAVTGPVNLGLGVGVNFIDMARTMCELSGKLFKPDFKAAEPVGAHYRVCDPSRMRQFYEPQISLTTGIAMALQDAEVTA